ncbi:MAG: collagen-like protein [Nostocaceae cyanobacterium]|nr:collagen-like protein [Nostocaceae cyanobacterium]
MSQLSVFAIVLSFSHGLLPAPKAFLASSAAWGKDLGIQGSSGQSGRSGRDGRSGQDQTLFVDGKSVNLDLSGENGEDGGDGDRGDDADCHHQSSDADHDLQAANGGRGGDGGRGGNAGNGGSVTIYYNNLADLKQVNVRSLNGREGRGGRGANGGTGCRCHQHHWEKRTSTGTPGTPEHKYEEHKYSCTDGNKGSDGSDGADGSKGSLGTLTIIHQKEPLKVEVPNVTVSISDLNKQVFNLSKNKWQMLTGAVSLLAPGSIIADEYREFVEQIPASVQVVWNETEPLSNFTKETATVSLNDERKIQVSFPKKLWIDGTQSQQNGVTKFVISHLIRQSEVTKLKVADFANSGSNLNLNVVDLASKSDLVATTFKIKYRTSDENRSRSDYDTRYEGNIPTELVKRDHNRFTIALGKLPINSNFLQSGVGVEIELVAIRSLGGRSTEQKIDWEGSVR